MSKNHHHRQRHLVIRFFFIVGRVAKWDKRMPAVTVLTFAIIIVIIIVIIDMAYTQNTYGGFTYR